MTIADFDAPSAAEFAAAKALLAPWRALTDPRIDGFENLPADGRYLLVGNHTTLGLFDVPFLVLDIHERTGVIVRSLGERQHYRVPLWRDLLTHFGTVSGTRENTRGLLGAGQPVLVFPGGGRAVARRRGEHYPLVWRERIGFARLAQEFGYPVVPSSMIGLDDMWDVVADADDSLYAGSRAREAPRHRTRPALSRRSRAGADAAPPAAADLRSSGGSDRGPGVRLVLG